MTFGGLALGIGMIVDASIVVLENTFRHMEMGKPRMQAAIEGSEEVWSAILASTLTHIAVFVPLLFLSGVSSILFVQLSYVVMFSLTMSLFVAVTVVPVLCSRLLKLPPPVEQRTGALARLFTVSERFFNGMDDFYRSAIHLALQHRPTVLHGRDGLTVAGVRDSADDSERARAAGRRRRSLGQRAHAGRHPHRTDRGGRASSSSRWSAPTCRRPTTHHLVGRRRRLHGRVGDERQHQRQARAARRAQALERSDRDRPPARARRPARAS